MQLCHKSEKCEKEAIAVYVVTLLQQRNSFLSRKPQMRRNSSCKASKTQGINIPAEWLWILILDMYE